MDTHAVLDDGDDDAITCQLAAEIARTGRPMALLLQATSVFQLAGLLQLALRHPGVPTTIQLTAAEFLTGVRQYFADAPTVLEVLRRGDDPAEDR